MNWIDKVRAKPREEKIKIIWIVIVITFLIMVALWIVSYRYMPKSPADSRLLQIFREGIYNIKNNFKK